ncbi:MAG: hypothetical protein H6911_04780 [Rickettsiaceae bacterium]|jgi:predicted PurR-regulated permease PerM|nr:hypothetical protein [Rickettsiaceae bacterium]
MIKNLVQLYSLVVCLIASVVIMITIGIMLGNTTDILLPEYKYMNQLDKFTSNEKYIDSQKQSEHSSKEKWQIIDPNLLAEKRLAERESYINRIKGDAISTVINCITWLITGLFFFVIHWRMYKGYSASNNLKE